MVVFAVVLLDEFTFETSEENVVSENGFFTMSLLCRAAGRSFPTWKQPGSHAS